MLNIGLTPAPSLSLLICGTETGRLNTLQTQRLDRLVHAQHWTDSCSLSLSLDLWDWDWETEYFADSEIRQVGSCSALD